MQRECAGNYAIVYEATCRSSRAHRRLVSFFHINPSYIRPAFSFPLERRAGEVGSLLDSGLFYGSLVARGSRLKSMFNVHTASFALSGIAEMDVLVGRGYEWRARARAHTCAHTSERGRVRLYAFFEGYSDEDI